MALKITFERRGSPALMRDEWLGARRKELYAGMRRRRQRQRTHRRSAGRSPLSLW